MAAIKTFFCLHIQISPTSLILGNISFESLTQERG